MPDQAREDGKIHIEASELTEQLSELLNRVRCQDHRLIIERHGKPVAAVVSVEDLETLEALEDEADRETLREIDDAETVPLEEMEAEVVDDD